MRLQGKRQAEKQAERERAKAEKMAAKMAAKGAKGAKKGAKKGAQAGGGLGLGGVVEFGCWKKRPRFGLVWMANLLSKIIALFFFIITSNIQKQENTKQRFVRFKFTHFHFESRSDHHQFLFLCTRRRVNLKSLWSCRSFCRRIPFGIPVWMRRRCACLRGQKWPFAKFGRSSETYEDGWKLLWKMRSFCFKKWKNWLSTLYLSTCLVYKSRKYWARFSASCKRPSPYPTSQACTRLLWLLQMWCLATEWLWRPPSVEAGNGFALIECLLIELFWSFPCFLWIKRGYIRLSIHFIFFLLITPPKAKAFSFSWSS